LFIVAMVLLDVLLMPRGNLLEWLSALLRNAMSILLLVLGWALYRLLTSIRRAPVVEGLPMPSTQLGKA